MYAPRQLISEFAIIKAENGNDWIGYRDVVQVDEKPVADRRDRLLRLLTSTTVDAARLQDIANESARFNVGPISRNFNVPTTVLFYFLPSTIERFSFERKGTKDLDGVVTWELEFKETARPTLIRTRDDRDVPASGRVWVTPTDGAVVRTRLELRGFADQHRDRDAPQLNSGPRQPNRPSMPQESDERRLESRAVVEVSYRFDRTLGASLPLRMSETYEGPMRSEGMRTLRLEIADSADVPARATAPMALQGPDANGRLLVGGSVDGTGLPAGDYVSRAVFESAGKRLGHTTRPIRVVVEPAARLAAAPVTPASQPPSSAHYSRSAARYATAGASASSACLSALVPSLQIDRST